MIVISVDVYGNKDAIQINQLLPTIGFFCYDTDTFFYVLQLEEFCHSIILI